MAFAIVAQVLWCPKYAYRYFGGMSLKVVKPITICPPLRWYRHGKKLELNSKNVPEFFSSTQCFNGSYRQIQGKLFAGFLNTAFSLCAIL